MIAPTEYGIIAGLVTAIIILAEVVKQRAMHGKPPVEGSEEGENGKSGQKPVSYWQREIRKAAKEGIQEALLERNEKVREIVRDELERALVHRGRSGGG